MPYFTYFSTYCLFYQTFRKIEAFSRCKCNTYIDVVQLNIILGLCIQVNILCHYWTMHKLTQLVHLLFLVVVVQDNKLFYLALLLLPQGIVSSSLNRTKHNLFLKTTPCLLAKTHVLC